MTFRVNYYAEQAFLSFVKKTLAIPHRTRDEEIEAGAVCVLACAAALEATVNSLLRINGKLTHYDELKLSSKIDTIADLAEESVDWGSRPWQVVAELIRLRNWLAHYKNPDIGLINSEGEWIIDESNRLPKIDPDRVLELRYVRRFYDGSREALRFLVEWSGAEKSIFEFLDSEDYESFLVG